jgi:hypothetical protein
MPGQDLKLDHDCFLPHPFQSSIHHHPVHWGHAVA